MLTAAQLFERMCAWDDENYILGAGTGPGQDTNDHDGIVDGHVLFTLSYSSLALTVYTHTHINTLHHACCYDEIKGTQDLRSILMLILRFSLLYFDRPNRLLSDRPNYSSGIWCQALSALFCSYLDISTTFHRAWCCDEIKACRPTDSDSLTASTYEYDPTLRPLGS